MGFPNDPEFQNFTDRLELLYRTEAVPPRTPRPTHVDALGYGAWEGRYVLRRDRGEDHETATRAIETEIRAIWQPEPEPQPTPNPIIGRLRYAMGASGGWSDDRGPVLPLFCHYMEAFSAWVHGKTVGGLTVEQQCQRIAAAGFQGIRVLDVLGYYDQAWGGKEITPIGFRNKSGAQVPATPDYYAKKRAFLEMVHGLGLKVLDDRGDLNAWSHQQKLDHMRKNGDLYASMGDVGWSVLAGVWACNESWQNGVPDHSEAAQMLMAFGEGGPGLPDMRGLSWGAANNDWTADPTGELIPSMKHWSIAPATVITMHGSRTAQGEHLTAHYLGYGFYENELRSYGKRAMNTEPIGGGEGITVGRVDDPERLTGIATEAILSGQGWTFMSGAGVFWERPIENEPGFQAVANLHKWLPRDLHSFQTIGHASKSYAILRDPNPGQIHVRGDYAIHGDGRFVLNVFNDGRDRTALPFARACAECRVIDVVGDRVQSDRPRAVGERFEEPYTWSRLVIGRLA